MLGESGKSTIFKHLLQFVHPVSEQELMDTKPHITQVMGGIPTLPENTQTFTKI